MEASMHVIVRDRREGKTTELIKWLLEGKAQEGYPGWSRVIVEPTKGMVVHADRMLKRHIADTGWVPRVDQMLDGRLTTKDAEHRVLADVRKAIWGMSDFNFNAVGRRDFEFAVDDLDQFISERFNYRMPTVITMTGELYGQHPSS
jgi:hypothetical protein